MAMLPRHPVVADPEEVCGCVEEAHSMIGHILSDIADPAVIVDAVCKDCPIVGATNGFFAMTGYQLEHVLGNNCRMLLNGVPQMAISRSARKNLQNYCEMCQLVGLQHIAEVTAVQPNARRDGSHFVNLFMLGLCRIRHRSLILGVQLPLGEGLFVRLSQAEMAKAIEAARTVFRRIRDQLQACTEHKATARHHNSTDFVPQPVMAQPDFAFFSERLQDHCVLLDKGFTAIRREPQELALNCLVFGDRPVRRNSVGMSFTVLVNQVTPTFSGLPVLGFTKRRPVDNADLYPAVVRCLGSSVLVGGCGEAFARDKHEHFVMGFKQPPKSEVQYWTTQAELPPHERAPPVTLEAGDLLQCTYLKEGCIQLLQNGNVVLEFDVERPIEEDCDYYPVVDICFSAYSLTVMPSAADSLPASEVGDEEEINPDSGVSTAPSRECTGHNPDISAVVNEVAVFKSIRAVIADCTFMVTIADPRGPDCPLIAVSEEFTQMTGFLKSEILGVNCRFLNQGCDMDPSDLARLRVSSATGAPFTAVIPNRKKSGELFLNLIDLRGLSIAQNPETGEDLWFLIGIQADVTNLAENEIPQDHLEDLQLVANSIRAKLAKELSEMAVEGVAASGGDSPMSSPKWRLLAEPEWRAGAGLGQQDTMELLSQQASVPMLPGAAEARAHAARLANIARHVSSSVPGSSSSLRLQSTRLEAEPPAAAPAAQPLAVLDCRNGSSGGRASAAATLAGMAVAFGFMAWVVSRRTWR